MQKIDVYFYSFKIMLQVEKQFKLIIKNGKIDRLWSQKMYSFIFFSNLECV